MDNQSDTNKLKTGNSFWGAIKSVAAAFLGVQSRKNWEDDVDSTRSPLWYIFAGLVLGFVFFGTVFLITWVIASFIV